MTAAWPPLSLADKLARREAGVCFNREYLAPGREFCGTCAVCAALPK